MLNVGVGLGGAKVFINNERGISEKWRLNALAGLDAKHRYSRIKVGEKQKHHVWSCA